MSNKETVYVNAFFNGTSHSLDSQLHLASALFHGACEDAQQINMGFDGCGITNKLIRGVVFGVGTEESAAKVAEKVRELVKQGRRVVVNAYGHSRGAIAAQLLAKMLGGFHEEHVEVNLALMDPVPGNAVWARKADRLSMDLANKSLDLSECRNLRRVLALYPYFPLPAAMLHAPSLPTYPVGCQVEEDVTLGGHSGAQMQGVFKTQGAPTEGKQLFFNGASFAVFQRVKAFMERCGTKFGAKLEELSNCRGYLRKQGKVHAAPQDANQALQELYQRRLVSFRAGSKPSASRAAHARENVTIDAVRGDQNVQYLNRHHRALAHAIPAENDSDLALRFVGRTPVQSVPAQVTDLTDQLKNFVAALCADFQKRNRKSRRVNLLAAWNSQIQSRSFADRGTLKTVLRNVLALTLQREDHYHSFFTTSHAGLTARSLLNKPEYKGLADVIVNHAQQPVRYRDMRTFVTSTNNKQYFHARNCETLCNLVSKDDVVIDHMAKFTV